MNVRLPMTTAKQGSLLSEIKREVTRLQKRGETAALSAMVLTYQEVLKGDPNNLEALVALGHLHSCLNEFSVALREYQQALVIQPLSPELFCYVGDACLGLEQAQQAQSAFEGALKIQPACTHAYVGLGGAYTHQGDLEAAIHAYQKALFYGVKDSDVWVRIGDLWGELGQWLNASGSYQNALLLAAEDAEIHYKLGNAWMRQTHASEAIKAYRKAVALRPAFAIAHLALGNAFALTKAFDQAIACYTIVVQQDKNNVEAYKNLSTLFSVQGNDAGLAFCNARLTQLGDNGKAASSPRTLSPTTAPEIAPETATTTPVRAVTPSRVFLAQTTDAPTENLMAIESLVLAPRVVQDEPLSALYQAVNQHPNSAKNYTQLADALAQQGDLNQAIAFYKIALKLSPKDFQIALQLKKSLDALQTGSPIASVTSTPVASTSVQLQRPASGVEGQGDGKRLPNPFTAHRLANLPGFPPDFDFPPIVGERNDYTFISDRMQAWVERGQPYHLPVSIIIPTYNRKDKLAKALAALTHQTYPQQLIEVIVADDGSSDGVEAVIEKYQSHLDLVHVRQPDLGFRLAAVCNLGMQAAKHDFFIFLQCDMIPRPQLVEAYMRHFHVAHNVFLIGGRQFVCSDDISDDQILADVGTALNLPEIKTNNEMWQGRKAWQDWREPLYDKTDNLKKDRYPYQAVVGSNLAFSKRLHEEIGGFCEDFHDWGGEDREYGYRAYNAGYYFIPVHEAKGLHQEPPDGINETDRRQGQKAAEAGCEAKCPLLLERKYQPGRIYEVPKVSLFMIILSDDKCGDVPLTKRHVEASIESALTQTHTDLEICIVCELNGDVAQMLERLCSNTTRVRRTRVRMQRLQTQTLGQACNAAMEMCRGAYIGQLTPGDVLKPTAVETLVSCLDRGTAGCVFGHYQVTNLMGARKQVSPPLCDYSRESLIQQLCSHRFWLFRMREWKKAAGRFQELDYATDYDLAVQLANVCSFQFVNQVLFTQGDYCLRLSQAQRQQQALEMAQVASHFVKRTVH